MYRNLRPGGSSISAVSVRIGVLRKGLAWLEVGGVSSSGRGLVCERLGVPSWASSSTWAEHEQAAMIGARDRGVFLGQLA